MLYITQYPFSERGLQNDGWREESKSLDTLLNFQLTILSTNKQNRWILWDPETVTFFIGYCKCKAAFLQYS